ncbi:MAG: divalent metal cation transporter [Planctomycetota bacterium]
MPDQDLPHTQGFVETPSRLPGWARSLGPCVLYAGAAIGVSHLVQSTRAGASYGLSLLLVVLLAHAMKYPAMVFAPMYAASTGQHLLDGYRARGRWAVVAFGIVTFGTMFIIQGVVTLITASLALAGAGDLGLQGVAGSPVWLASAGVLLVAGLLLAVGGYRWLKRALNVLMLLLLVVTLAAAASQVPSLDWSRVRLLPAPGDWVVHAAFIVALAGWMPAPLDITVWNSMWTLEQRRDSGHRATRREAKLDFDLGYLLCVLTATSFMLLGTTLLFQPGVQPEATPVAFVGQVIDLYAEAIGEWARPVVGVGALAVMLSTTVTVLDGLPRSASGLLPGGLRDRRASYWSAMLLIALGAQAIIVFSVGNASFTALIDFATMLAFLSTPVLALLNHLCVTGREMPAEDRPGRTMRLFSLISVVLWAAFAAVFLCTRFAPSP